MDSLRLTLIIIGLLVVGGIYLKFRSSDDDLIFWLKKLFNPVTKIPDASDENDLIPVLSAIDDEPDVSDFEALSKVISGRAQLEEYSKQQEMPFSAIDDTSETGSESLLIVLNIMPPEKQLFSGEGIHAVMISAGLRHGEHKIYHYLQDNVVVFSIANAIEPGFFELSQLKTITTPGLAVFMELPGPLECRKAFDILLLISKRIANALSGELCDESRSILTRQTISHLKDKIESYRLKQKSSQHIKHN